MYDACRVAQLLSEVHHTQRMRHSASKICHGSWGCAKDEHSVTSESSLPLQTTDRSITPPGLGADAPASQTQLISRQQMGRMLQMAREQPSLDGDAGHAWGIVTAQLRTPHAPDPGSMELTSNRQRPPDQRPVLSSCSSKRDMQPNDRESVTAQHSPTGLEAISTSIARSEGMSGKSVQRPNLGHSAPASLKGRTAGAYQQTSNRMILAPVKTLSQLSALHLKDAPGHIHDPRSKSSSAPRRSATHTRYEHVPLLQLVPCVQAAQRPLHAATLQQTVLWQSSQGMNALQAQCE